MAFTAKKIIDGNTIEVSPDWKWKGETGTLVRIIGYDVPNEKNMPFIVNKLITLINNLQVELKNPTKIEEKDGNKIVYCSIYLNEIDISQYFPELKSTS